jgi:hypothetical protein
VETPLWRPRRRRKVNITTVLEEIRFEDLDYFQLPQNKAQWWAHVDKVVSMKLSLYCSLLFSLGA